MKTASRQTRNIRIIVALIPVALAVSAVVVYELASMQKGETIISGSVIVVADNYNATSFYTPAGANIYISGNFSAQIASGPNTGATGTIRVLIVNDTYYEQYVTVGSLPSNYFYDSGDVPGGSFNVNLPANTPCWIVYWDNDPYSMIVASTVKLHWIEP